MERPTELENYGNVLNVESCDGDTGAKALLGDWRLLAAWVGSLLVATMATALMGSVIQSKDEVFSMIER